MIRTLPFGLLLCSLILGNHTQAQDVRSQLQQLANDLSKQIEAKGKKRVVIASFLSLDNKETQLGRYMADKFGIGVMKANTSLQLTDRSQLAQVLRDNKLGAERILDPKTIPTLGRLTGAEVIVTGNYTALDNSLDITVKAIDLERGVTLAVTEGSISRTSEINKLLGQVDETRPDEGGNEPVTSTKLNCKSRNAAGVLFSLKQCTLTGRTLTCDLIVSNNRDDRSDAPFTFYSRDAHIVTNNGKQYGANLITLGNISNASIIGNVSRYTALYGVTVNASVEFGIDDSSVKTLQIFEMQDQGLRCQNIPVVSSSSR